MKSLRRLRFRTAVTFLLLLFSATNVVGQRGGFRPVERPESRRFEPGTPSPFRPRRESQIQNESIDHVKTEITKENPDLTVIQTSLNSINLTTRAFHESGYPLH
jgi:hypothetical protein